MSLVTYVRNFLYATATLIGTIVGVGVFGIPYVTAQAGFWVGQFYIVFLALVTLTVHLLYGEVVASTAGEHRLVGYAERYLGIMAKLIVSVAFFFSGYASLLAYIIVAGMFGETLSAGQFSAEAVSMLFWVAGSLAVWAGLRTVGKGEFIMSIFLIATMGMIFWLGMPHIRPEHFEGWSLKDIFLPYGVILFALSGATAIPEIRDLAGGHGKKFGLAITFGTLIPAVLYMAFAAVVVGVSGPATSQEAIRGLLPALGKDVVGIGSLFAFLAIATSFLAFGVNIKNTLIYDFHIPTLLASLLTVGPPGLLFLGGVRQFIDLMDIAGAVLGAIIGVSILKIAMRARTHGDHAPDLRVPVPSLIIYGVMAALIGGGILQVGYILLQSM